MVRHEHGSEKLLLILSNFAGVVKLIPTSGSINEKNVEECIKYSLKKAPSHLQAKMNGNAQLEN